MLFIKLNMVYHCPIGYKMQKYIVGGFIRDTLLGLKPNDRDWVVVGETPDSMIAAGFKQVGADFPVFLDDMGEEHALARTERKTGKGYHGFETTYDSSVTLEDDLRRRDLTINAMAMDEDGNIIDPFGGQEDLQEGVLRHVSEAFGEDPVRVLRVARFAARFDYSVSKPTLNLMKNLAKSGELDSLTNERVWLELEKMISTAVAPEKFFGVLKKCKALKRVFPCLVDMNYKKIEHNCTFDFDECNFASIFFHVDVEVMEELEESIGIPKRFMKFFRRVKYIEDFCARHIYVDESYGLMRLFQECNAWKEEDQFYLALDTIRIMKGEGLIAPDSPSTADYTWLLRIKECFDEGKKYTFEHLTDIQKECLKGEDIAWAINNVRRTKIEENMFYR